MTTNNCEGCNTTDTCEYIKKSNKCPCRICIVKGMCDTTCDDYLLFTDCHTATFNALMGDKISYKPFICKCIKSSIFGRK